jgi:hypothetical protein
VSAKGAYLSDITFGTSPHQRGNWLDRLPAIDEDIAAVEKKLESTPAIGQWRSSISLGELTVPAKREWLEIDHTPASRFVPGRQLEIAIEVEPGTESLAARLHYRHVNQAERYQSTDFEAAGHRFSAVIPATYTNSSYPLQYYFELCRGTGNAWLFPGLGKDLNTQPYFVIRPA